MPGRLPPPSQALQPAGSPLINSVGEAAGDPDLHTMGAGKEMEVTSLRTEGTSPRHPTSACIPPVPGSSPLGFLNPLPEPARPLAGSIS